ncbi:hypothetical protein PHLGIDRAFT_459411 [Phlebiopsis gigantea 11061_1 CR5-6]|uniref:F-box domain-containing protein n=1 Tax=Phlebiopsis gigantea (strain 11061_1 CR5-6) TaxID=745531 RepID=A0A0C3NN30_PHLG1|nr:hypothetical protein PHLGIDRAFT_459411 [Phlebiopsis gigantea 11061_1 CR5-6]
MSRRPHLHQAILAEVPKWSAGDAEDSTLTQVSTLTREKHDGLVPVNRLPTEILCTIFERCVLDEDQRAAVPITHVCSRWRSISLSWPVLWSQIDFSSLSPRQAKLFLERAGKHPLYLERCNPLKVTADYEALCSRIHAVKHLSIDNRCSNSNYSTDDSLPDPTSALHFLAAAPAARAPLIITNFSWAADRGLAELPEILDAPLFGGNSWTPHLRYLALEGVRMPWKRGFYSNLHTLELKRFKFDLVVHRNEDICNVLADCPGLRKLVLRASQKYAFPRWFTAFVPHAPLSIHLSHLLHLELSLPPNYIAHILQSIVVGSIPSIDISFCNTACSVQDITACLGSPVILSHLAFSDTGELDSSFHWQLRLLECTVTGSEPSQGNRLQFCGFVERPQRADEPTLHTYRINVLHDVVEAMRPFVGVVHVQSLRFNERYGRLRAFPSDPASRILPCSLLPCTSLRLYDDAVACTFHDPIVDGNAAAELCPDLTNLYIVSSARLRREELLSLVEWCKSQDSIRTLSFEGVELWASSKKKFKALAQEVDDLLGNITVLWDDNCLYDYDYDSGFETSDASL